MKTLTWLTASAFALGLAACGGAQDAAPAAPTQTEPQTDMTTAEPMDHSAHDMGDGTTGHTTGVIQSVGSEGDSLTIDHGPIDGVGMGAMTMGFDIVSGVDLSGFAEGDEVGFMVKKGRDNSYRITAICNTGKDGADCLEGMMDH